MLPLSPDSLASRATIGLIDPLGLAFLLVGCLLLPLSSPDDCARLLGVSHRSWYQIVVWYPGDCCVGVLELGTSSVFVGEYFGIHTENIVHVSSSTSRLFCIAVRYHQVSDIRCSILLILAGS